MKHLKLLLLITAGLTMTVPAHAAVNVVVPAAEEPLTAASTPDPNAFSRTPDRLVTLSENNHPTTVTVHNPNNQILRRVYNPNSGEHFYTASQAEYDYLGALGWQQEMAGWIAPRISTMPIYRLYNPNAGDHHYTANEAERDYLVSLGWNDEGIGWYGSTRVDSVTNAQIPVYRLYNPNAVAGAHHYTTNADERAMLVSVGWNDEGIGWYADPDQVQDGCEVIEHRGSSGAQSMFYTVTTPEGGIVMIDGGWKADYQTVRRCCSAYDDRIDAWIVTHPHPDHIEAINEVLAQNPEVQISTLYTTPVNDARYYETVVTADEPEDYERFKRLSAHLNKQYLRENDHLKLLGLDLRVLHSWGESVEKLTADRCNQGGLMFRLSGTQHSMLFCADLGKRIEGDVLAKHADELQCDYVQCAHHGNWGFSTTLYDRIHPKLVFMDAPDSIIRTDAHRYDGFKLVEYWEKRGVPIHSFRDGDGQVVL